MPSVDPFASLHDWRAALYRADAPIINRFLDVIDASLPPGWVRDRDYEKTRLRPDRIHCYMFDQVGDAQVRVWLQRVADARLRGGPVELLRHAQSAGTERTGQLVADFSNACVQPAAATAGAQCTRPAFGPLSAIAPAAEMLFTQFADAADGRWPLREHEQRLWDELISTCLTEQVGIDRGELKQWLADSGWHQRDIPAIVDRFYADSEWLAKRLVAAP